MSLVLVSEVQSGIKIVKLNRPEKLNALSKDLLEELTLTLKQLTSEAQVYKTKAVIVSTSTSKAFCAGADLVERSTMSVEQVSETLLVLRNVMDTLSSLTCPTIAAMQGVAFGGGLELALACDLRVACPEAKMGLSEVKLGIIPGAGGTQRLSRLVGAAKAKELIFMAKTLSAEEALRCGVINCVSQNADETALDWAQQILEMGPIAVSSAKLAIDHGVALPLKEGLDWERRCYDNVLHSGDRLEGIKSFIEKRKPKYLAH